MEPHSPVAGPPRSPSLASTSANGLDEPTPPSTSDAPLLKPHVCREGCTAAFSTQGHRSRHERSHKQDLKHECPRCKKRFVRSDVLSRHVSAIHGEGASRKGRKPSCASCSILKVRCDGPSNETCDRCAKAGTPCTYKSRSGRSNSIQRGILDSTSRESMEADLRVAPDSENTQRPSNEDIQHLMSFDAPLQRLQSPPPADFNPSAFSSMRASKALQSMPAFDFSFSSSYDAYVSDAATTLFDNDLGWGMGDTNFDLITALGTLEHQGGRATGTTTPSTDWLLSLGNFENTSPSFEPPAPPAPPFGGVNSFIKHMEDREGEAAETMTDLAQNAWPHVYHPPSHPDPLALPSVTSLPSLSAFPLTVGEIRISDDSRTNIVSLVHSSHQSPWPSVSTATFPSIDTISVCLNLYFQRFQPTFPILNKEKILKGDAQPVLLLAIAAIGATYSPKLEGLGVALAELVRRSLQYLCEVNPRLSFEVYIIQAQLLHSIFSLFSGSRKLYHSAEVSRSGLVTAARRLGLLRSQTTCVEELSRRPEGVSPDELRAAYIEDEERLRLGWGIYYFDTQISTLLNLQALFSVTEISKSTPLPIDGSIFTGDPKNLSLWTDAGPRPFFRQTLDDLITNGSLSQPLTPFGGVLLAMTLYRLCLDASYADAIFSAPKAPSLSPYRIPFPSSFKHNPQALLDNLTTGWFQTSSSPSPLIVASTALSLHACIAFGSPDFDFMVEAKSCARKYGPGRSEVSRAKMRQSIGANPSVFRRILVHAAQLSGLLMRFTFDAPSEVTHLTDACIALWVIIKFSGSSLTEGPSALKNRTTLQWSDSTSLESWIEFGGPLTIKGTLGDLSKLTPARVLVDFMDKIETLPWGLWRKLKGVLMALSLEEDAGDAEGAGTPKMTQAG